MESPLPHGLSPSELAPPVNRTGAIPLSLQTVVLTQQAYIALTWQAHYGRAQYEPLVAREAAVKAAIAAQQATIRTLTQRLYVRPSAWRAHAWTGVVGKAREASCSD